MDVTPDPNLTERPRRSPWSTAIPLTLSLVVLHALVLRAQGRIWWCACGSPAPWSGQVASMHNSQHVIDWYTPSHVLHGLLFYGLLWLTLRRWSVAARLVVAAGIEVAWELLENSPIIIDRYRAQTAALGYEGDSIANSVADVASCILGFLIARRVGLWPSVALFVAAELFTLWWIRDNLTLNVVMLLYPIDAIRQWQGTLSGPG